MGARNPQAVGRSRRRWRSGRRSGRVPAIPGLSRAILISLLAAAGLAVSAASAEAGFRINRSMEGVRIGMSQAEVRERLGRPARRELGPDFVNWRYRRPSMHVTFKPRVITLFTRSPFVRGRRDIGVGTHERRLRRVVSELRASPPRGSGSLRGRVRDGGAQHGLRHARRPGPIDHDLAEHAVSVRPRRRFTPTGE